MDEVAGAPAGDPGRAARRAGTRAARIGRPAGPAGTRGACGRSDAIATPGTPPPVPGHRRPTPSRRTGRRVDGRPACRPRRRRDPRPSGGAVRAVRGSARRDPLRPSAGRRAAGPRARAGAPRGQARPHARLVRPGAAGRHRRRGHERRPAVVRPSVPPPPPHAPLHAPPPPPARRRPRSARPGGGPLGPGALGAERRDERPEGREEGVGRSRRARCRVRRAAVRRVLLGFHATRRRNARARRPRHARARGAGRGRRTPTRGAAPGGRHDAHPVSGRRSIGRSQILGSWTGPDRERRAPGLYRLRVRRSGPVAPSSGRCAASAWSAGSALCPPAATQQGGAGHRSASGVLRT